jgi:hypothetical protein
MPNEVDGSDGLAKAIAQEIDLFCQGGRQHKRPRIISITGNIGRDDLVPACQLLREPRPLMAGAERTMQGYHGARDR